MNNKQVAHLWAAQSQPSAKGSNFYFDGRTIYSYGAHFPIATFTDAQDENGRRIVLFNGGSYSVTTSKHQAYARNALHGLPVRVITVDRLESTIRDGMFGHPDNLRAMVKAYDAQVLKVARARSNGEWLLGEANKIAADARTYAAAFDLPAPDLAPIDAELLATVRERAKRDAAAKAEQTKARAAARAARYLELIGEWRAGGSAAELWQFSGEPTALRLAADGAHVETSRGATVTLRTARILWRALQTVRDATSEARAELAAKFRDIDGFTLREIRADGSVIIGCHTLTAAEVDAFAASQGWTP